VVDGAGHLGAHPPPGVGREADAAVGVEALGGAQQADVALLDEVLLVHERPGELARLAVGDAATRHRERQRRFSASAHARLKRPSGGSTRTTPPRRPGSWTTKFRTNGLEVNRKRRRDNSLTFAQRRERPPRRANTKLSSSS
jgi:hypothetical protein